MAECPLAHSSSFRPLARGPQGCPLLAFRPALPTLQHSRQCLCFVPYTSEIFVYDETSGFSLSFWKLGAFKRQRTKNVCVRGDNGRAAGTWGPAAGAKAFQAAGVWLVDGRGWKPNYECHSRDHTAIFLDEETEPQCPALAYPRWHNLPVTSTGPSQPSDSGLPCQPSIFSVNPRLPAPMFLEVHGRGA